MGKHVGETAETRIGPRTAVFMRGEIEAAGGREVFFAGTLDGHGQVRSARVCARGTEDAVLAFLEGIEPREVVIHNHPTGDIAPSSPDMEVAAACGNNGHGVYIVDNAVSRVFVVVEPFLDRDLHLLDPRELARAFRPDGAFARTIPQYEVRPQQLRMMEAVAQAFNANGIAVVEAPTGVGKTLAYLIPAVQWALRNRERVVVATRTINLQEQIMFKDVPTLAKCLPETFRAVLVKGRGNYLCRRKLERVLSEATLFEEADTEEALKTIAAWVAKTEDGSLSDLPFVPDRNLWDRVRSEADTCAGPQCPNARTCFVTKARREVARADLIVANHHLVFSDIAVKRDLGDFSSLAVLPAYKRVVFDEAHNIEDSATEYFGASATLAGALALVGRLVRKERLQERGLIPFIKLKLVKTRTSLPFDEVESVLDLIDNRLLPAIAASREALVVAFDALRSLAAERCGRIGRDIKWRLTQTVLDDPELRRLHAVYVLPAVEEIRQCAQHCAALIDVCKRARPEPDDPESPLLTERIELQGCRLRLENLANVLAEGTSAELQPNTVRWIEIDARNENIFRIVRCPLEVGQALEEWAYANLDTVVMTSATLTVQRRFDYLFARIGLDRVAPDRVETLELDTPFDFEKQALLCIPRDICGPDDRSFPDETVDCLRDVLRITRGHALALFTSFYALDHAFRRLEEELRGQGITPLKQGAATRTQLLDRFRADISSVLFATDSFWEGIDVAGDALQCVILQKLPFRVPTEPIQQARAEAVDAAGGNSFMEYTVPQAVIKFRQGFGRLIRRKTDTGAIVVFDRRVVTKYYGKVFLDSLPGVRIAVDERNEVLRILSEFFAAKAPARRKKTT